MDEKDLYGLYFAHLFTLEPVNQLC